MWWDNAVVYQIYPRSFQDTDGDGIGDLPGVIERLDHVARLGASAIWLSPFYPSPNADFGYDVADYTGVDPAYGTLEDVDRLLSAAHERNLKVLLDFVPCHSSTEHPWFRARPDYYFWADAPPNNWRAAFGGPAWERDERTGRFYLHSFFPEQADLNWRNPDVRAAMQDALRFWRERGVDGFRVDAVDRLLKDRGLRDDPPARTPSVLPQHPEYGAFEHVHSANAPDIGVGLQAIRDAVNSAVLVGETYLPTSQLAPYLEVFDVAFAFEPMNAGPDAARVRSAIRTALDVGHVGWVLSNHDFQRFASRFGANVRAAAMLFLSLPGPAFMFQGDELGMPDGPGVEPPLDRAGRDGYRHPMQWDASRHGGFTTGTPWLPTVDAADRNVEDQERDKHSTLSLYRQLIALRPQLGPRLTFLESSDNTVVFERGSHVVAVNFGEQPSPVTRNGELLVEAHPGDGADRETIPPHGGWIAA